MVTHNPCQSMRVGRMMLVKMHYYTKIIAHLWAVKGNNLRKIPGK